MKRKLKGITVVKDDLKYEINKRSYAEVDTFAKDFDGSIIKLVKICMLNKKQILVFEPSENEYGIINIEHIMDKQQFLEFQKERLKLADEQILNVLQKNNLTLKEYLKLKEELCQD